MWFSAPGAIDRQTVLRPAPVVVDTLRASALAGDTSAWKNALAGLDATMFADLHVRAERGDAIALTDTCGNQELLETRYFGGQRGAAFADRQIERLHKVAHGRLKQAVLVLEVVADDAVGHPGNPRDIGDAGIAHANLVDRFEGGRDQL